MEMIKKDNIEITQNVIYQTDRTPWFEFVYIRDNDDEKLEKEWVFLEKKTKRKDGVTESIHIADNNEWIGNGFVKLILNRYFELTGERVNFAFEEVELNCDEDCVTDEQILKDLDVEHLKEILRVISGLHQRDLLDVNEYLLLIINKIVNNAE